MSRLKFSTVDIFFFTEASLNFEELETDTNDLDSTVTLLQLDPSFVRNFVRFGCIECFFKTCEIGDAVSVCKTHHMDDKHALCVDLWMRVENSLVKNMVSKLLGVLMPQ